MTRRFTRSINILLYITIVLISSSIVGAEQDEPAAQVEWHQWRGVNRDGISLETNILKMSKRVVADATWRGLFGDLNCERTRLYHVRQRGGRGCCVS